jgi:hypothetical protein
MAERQRAREAVQISTAVENMPVLTATETYTAKRHELENIEQQLAHLHSLQAGGTRLDRDQTLDMLVLEEDVLQLRNEAERLRAPMEAEQLALDIADTVEVMNDWTALHLDAFHQLVQAIDALWWAKEAILDVHRRQSDALHGLPAFRNLQVSAIPTGESILHDVLSRLPEAHAWMGVLLSPHAGPLTKKTVEAMAEVYTTAKTHDVRHMTRQVQTQRTQHGNGLR